MAEKLIGVLQTVAQADLKQSSTVQFSKVISPREK